MLKNTECVMAIEAYMYQDHQMLRRAAIQCMLNLCQSPVQVERYEGQNDKMKYMVLLMADEDEEIVKAAAGAVAMLTSASTKLCQKIYESSQWEACMLNTLANKDFEVTYRGVVIVDNVVQCGKEIAEPMMDTQVMDVCQALIAKANLDEGNAVVNETLQKIKKICDHALNLAHSMGIIKTYSQAVQEDEDDEALEPWRPHPTAPST